ncbi:MAG TPA: M17 family peptidase N-terminal domain-containing protein, partial [Rugosimonospora sp.]|nr:M17 family peptidase N-terminal domain-containing protein [Rugosimonospora sp.]
MTRFERRPADVLTVRLVRDQASEPVPALAVPVAPTGGDDDPGVEPLVAVGELEAELRGYLADSEHSGAAGVVRVLPRPLGTPRRVYAVGVAEGGEPAWRSAGAGLVRAAGRDTQVTWVLPESVAPAEVRALAEGALLAGYRYRLGEPKPDAPVLAELVLVVPTRLDGYEQALAQASV